MDAFHILAIPVPLPGHMIPMLNLCCKLVSMGCRKITFLINQDKFELLQDLQKQLEKNGDLNTGVISAESLPAVLPPAFTEEDDEIQRRFLMFWQMLFSGGLRIRPTRLIRSSLTPFKFLACQRYELLRHVGRAKEAKAILVNSCNDLEKDVYEAVVAYHGLPLRFVGPLITPLSKNSSGSECLEWLDAKEPGSVIYISFGGFLKWTSAELEEILTGIKESGYGFLLAFTMDDLLDETSPTLEKFLQSFSGDQKSSSTIQGFIVPWAPQLEILNHPSTGGFFTHYGWNSVSESISAGVPMIGKPVLDEQFVMRKLALEKWKIAVNIEEDANKSISKGAVKDALMKLMEDEEIKGNAARLKSCIQRAVSEGGDSYKSLQQL